MIKKRESKYVLFNMKQNQHYVFNSHEKKTAKLKLFLVKYLPNIHSYNYSKTLCSCLGQYYNLVEVNANWKHEIGSVYFRKPRPLSDLNKVI